MFVEPTNKEKKLDSYAQKPPAYQSSSEAKKSNWVIFVVIGIVLLLVIIGGITYFVFIEKPTPVPPPIENNNPPENPVASGTLPINDPNRNGNGTIISSTTPVNVEELSFGYFYEKPEINFKSSLINYKLPINIKADDGNYRKISKKINLDPYVNYINQNGFAVSPNQFTGANDFYSVYRDLNKNDIPIVITTDFLLYNYQNNLKDVFADIEQNVFYENIWELNKNLFNIASARYKALDEEIANKNDPFLEGARQEAAFFAVALELLKPAPGQINSNAELVDDNKFNPKEVDFYSFTLPEYLNDDVKKEVALIRGAKEKTKSPVMLYDLDYNSYKVPPQYQNNAKLNNFYLVTQWLNTVFPIYYQSENCPDCLLDKDDWVINMIAGSLISQDLYDDEKLKEQWAIIYKFIAYFTGLRQDLTYLQYYHAYDDRFGKNFDIQEIFSKEKKDGEKEINKLQNEIGKKPFPSLEGGFSRVDPADYSKIGMRILQSSYWPNDYILNFLTGKDMWFNGGSLLLPEAGITTCQIVGTSTRCSGFGLDIINLLNPIKEKFLYFTANTSYDLYNKKVEDLKKQLDTFDKNAWNDNIYWSTLDLMKVVLNYNIDGMPIYQQNEQWKRFKDYNTALGAWVNIHIPPPVLAVHNYGETGNFNFGKECNLNNYVEPDLRLMETIKAKNKMVIDMLTALNISQKTSKSINKLMEFNDELDKFEIIAKDELTNKELSEDGCEFIVNFAQKYDIINQPNQEFFINSKIGNKRLTESINGIKLLTLVYKKGNNEILTLGPIFNYIEK